jgi:transposase
MPRKKLSLASRASQIETIPTLNVSDLEELAITRALTEAGGSVGKAAKLLGIGRATLYRRVEAFGLLHKARGKGRARAKKTNRPPTAAETTALEATLTSLIQRFGISRTRSLLARLEKRA